MKRLVVTLHALHQAIATGNVYAKRRSQKDFSRVVRAYRDGARLVVVMQVPVKTGSAESYPLAEYLDKVDLNEAALTLLQQAV